MALISQLNMKALLQAQSQLDNSAVQTVVTDKVNEAIQAVNTQAGQTQSQLQTETNQIDSKLNTITSVSGNISTEVQAINTYTHQDNEALKQNLREHINAETIQRANGVKAYVYSRFKDTREMLMELQSSVHSLPFSTHRRNTIKVPLNTTLDDLDQSDGAFYKVADRNGYHGFVAVDLGINNVRETVLTVNGAGQFYGAIGRLNYEACVTKWIFTIDGVETIVETRDSQGQMRHVLGEVLEAYTEKVSSNYHSASLVAKRSQVGRFIKFHSSFKLELEHSSIKAQDKHANKVYLRYELLG